MKVALANNGINVGIFIVARLMKQAGIIAKIPKKPHYYPSGKQKPTIPNVLKRQFDPPQVNTHWVGDITYLRHHQERFFRSLKSEYLNGLPFINHQAVVAAVEHYIR